MTGTQTRRRYSWTDWGQWAVENAIKINPGKIIAVSFMRWSGQGHSKLLFGGTKEFRKPAAANI